MISARAMGKRQPLVPDWQVPWPPEEHDAGEPHYMLDQLLGDRDTSGYGRRQFQDLATLTKRQPPVPSVSHAPSDPSIEFHRLNIQKAEARLWRFEFLLPLVERCRKRILAVELTRGDNPTAASSPSLSLSSVKGIATLVAILRTLGQRNFVRGWLRDNQSLETVLSHLARCSFPLDGETALDFKREVAAANLSGERLVELAVYAPQWAEFVAHALGWPAIKKSRIRPYSIKSVKVDCVVEAAQVGFEWPATT
jgi:hypothetical protein